MALAAPLFAALLLALGLLLLLLRIPPRDGTPRDVLVLAVVTGLAFAGGIVAGRFVFHSGFAVLRLWFDAILFGVAPLGLTVAVRAWRQRRGGFAATVGALSAVVLAIGAYALRVEPFSLEVNRHAIVSERLPAGRAEPLVVAVLADLQTDRIGRYERRVFEELDALRADLWLLPGDYLQCGTRERRLRAIEELASLFDELKHVPPLGIWAVDGDVDRAPQSITSERVSFLRNETVRLGDSGLQLHGLGTPASRQPVSDGVLADIDAFDGLTLVVGHAPDFMLSALNGRVDREAVLVAGHTHGGQVVVPGYGPPMTLSRVPRWLAAGGVHGSGDTTLCVSRGVGLERGYAPRIRFLCRPEIVVLELYGPAR
ncbi:MAG: hypothetical protein AAF726_00755 [Planctomycetota bacterium]